MADFDETSKPAPNVEELQAKLATLQSKLVASKEQVVRDALHAKILEIAAELGPEIAAKAAEAAKLPAPKKKKELEDITLPEPPSAAAQLQADELIRRARVAKMRGQVQETTDLIQQASTIAPGSPLVLEMLGDEMMARKLYGDARRAYLIAHRLDPRNVAIERKYAQTVLRTSGGMTIESAIAIGLDSPFMNPDDSMASPKIAVILSLILPGVGQLVLGQTKKGLILVGSYLLGIITLMLMGSDFEALVRSMKGLPHTGFNGLSLIPLAGMLVITIIAVQGCAARAKTNSVSGPRHVERPVPPVNLPFE